MKLKLKKGMLKKLNNTKVLANENTGAVVGGLPLDSLYCETMTPCLTKETCTDCLVTM